MSQEPPPDDHPSNTAVISRITSMTTEEVAGRKQTRRERQPVWYCKIITTYPNTAFGLTLFGHILMMLITVILMQTGYDILPFKFERVPLDIVDDVDYLRGMAFKHRNADDNVVARGAAFSAEENQTERSVTFEVFEMIFQAPPGGNVFTADNLAQMELVEREFYENDLFQANFCVLSQVTKTCAKPMSVLRYFDGSLAMLDPVFNDTSYQNVASVIYAAYTNNKTRKMFLYHLGKDAVVDATQAKSEITRANFAFGAPLSGFLNTEDAKEDQENIIESFQLTAFLPAGEKYFTSGVGEMGFIYNSRMLLVNYILTTVMSSMYLILGGLVFIFCFMCLQTGSVWVTGWAVLSIVTGFCGANLVYRIVLDIRYFGMFHILAIFIILGIGADDIFVFFDTWKETSHGSYPSLAHRLSDAYRRAATAMFYTSLTTAVAFIVSAASPFVAVSSFGVFSGLLVAVNYISVIVFFPCTVVTYHLYFEKYRCCCCCPQQQEACDPDNDEADFETPVAEASPSDVIKRKHWVVKFFRMYYFKLISHKVFRWVVLGLTLTVLVVFAYFAAQLKVNDEQTQLVSESTNLGKYMALRSSAFKPSYVDNAVKVHLVWGLRQQDMSSCHQSDVDCTGKTVWDDTFDLQTEETQQALLDFCQTLKTLPDNALAALHMRKSMGEAEAEVSCFVDDMKEFYEAEGSRTTKVPPLMLNVSHYPANTSFSVPISPAEGQDIIRYNPLIYNETNIQEGFNRYFELALSFWLYNGFKLGDNAQQYQTYNSLLGETRDPPYTIEHTFTLPTAPPTELVYRYGTKLRYAAIVVNTTISGYLGYQEGLPIRDAWESFMTKQMAKMPVGLKGGVQTTPNKNMLWHWLKVQEAMVTSAVMGLAIGIGLALPVLVMATHNLLIGLVATLTICCTTVSVIGVIPLAGWKLGVLESLNLVLVVGLSVDYVVHLAEGYSRSEHTKRLGRTRDTLEEVGISVISGAITTLGASLFLFFAGFLFFTQFGIFIFCTIGFSLFYALGLFVTLMGILGPEDEFCSTRALWRKCKSKFKRRS